MGNEQLKRQKNQQLSISVNHPHCTNAKLITEGGEKKMQLTIGVDLTEYEKWKQGLMKTNLNSPTLLLPKKQEFIRKGLCGDSGTIKLNFDNYSYLLSEQIKSRVNLKTKFEEWQLWYLLLNLSDAQHYMKSKTGQKVGDIRPQNVFLNESGDIKLSNVYSWPREITNYRKTFENQKTYLAPEDMKRLQKGIMEDSGSFSSEVFSIGLTILSAAMLKDFLILYDIKSYEFNIKEATSLLNEWKTNKNYSQIFTAVVANLCSFFPNKRLDENQLWNWLFQYEKPIREKKDFVIYSAPSKIDQQVLELRKNLMGNQNNYPPLILKGAQSSDFINDQSYVEPYTSEIHGSPPNQAVNKQKQSRAQSLPFANQPLPIRKFYIDNNKPNINMNINIFQGYYKEPTQMGHYIPVPTTKPGGQVQLSSQFVNKADNNTYFTPQFKNNYENSPYHQSYLPIDKKREQLNAEGQDSNSQKINYFQDIIYPQRPWGGRIEETIYIQRPEAGHQQSLQQHK